MWCVLRARRRIFTKMFATSLMFSARRRCADSWDVCERGDEGGEPASVSMGATEEDVERSVDMCAGGCMANETSEKNMQDTQKLGKRKSHDRGLLATSLVLVFHFKTQAYQARNSEEEKSRRGARRP